MRAAFPDKGSSHSEEGDAVHWMSAEVLQSRGGTSFLGKSAPNGVEITQDMIDASRVYVEAIAAVVPGLGTTGVIVEQPVLIGRIDETCYGTPDARYFFPATKELHVWDLKYGWGIVEPENNEQGICYMLGILDELSTSLKKPIGLLDQGITCHFHIVQPRPHHRFGPARTWTVNGAALRSEANYLRGAAQEAKGGNPRCITGTHCKYCPARQVCPAALKAAYNAIDAVDLALPDELTIEASVAEYQMLKKAERAIANRLSGREGQLIALIQSGTWVPGLSLDRGMGRVTWDKSVGEIIALGDALGKNLRAPETVITPAKARAKGIDPTLVAAFSSAGPSAIKLVASADSFASKAFSANS